MREKELFELRPRIGMVFQEWALFDSLNVEDNVAFRLNEEHVRRRKSERRVLEALRFVEMEHTMKLFPSELSGGMRRRVAIARAIVTEPELLLYDSPTAGLDPVTSTTIVELLVKQRDVYKTSALLVTHRLQDAFTMATHYFNTEENKMVEVPRGSDWDSKTSFLVLKDGARSFEGTRLKSPTPQRAISANTWLYRASLPRLSAICAMWAAASGCASGARFRPSPPFARRSLNSAATSFTNRSARQLALRNQQRRALAWRAIPRCAVDDRRRLRERHEERALACRCDLGNGGGSGAADDQIGVRKALRHIVNEGARLHVESVLLM